MLTIVVYQFTLLVFKQFFKKFTAFSLDFLMEHWMDLDSYDSLD